MRFSLALLFALLSVPTACRNSTNRDYQPPSYSSSSPAAQPPPASADRGLTDAKVETAVNSMLADWRLGGSVRVRGVQELPPQNAAIADLQFDDFQYGTTFEGGLLKAKDFKPRPRSNDPIPHPDEMFPQRKTVYSKEGKAVLSRYNDGRWFLKEVRWGFDTGVKGTVEIR